MLCDVLLCVVVFVRRTVRVSFCNLCIVSCAFFPCFFFSCVSTVSSPVFFVGIFSGPAFFRYRSVFSLIFSFVVHDEGNFCSCGVIHILLFLWCGLAHDVFYLVLVTTRGSSGWRRFFSWFGSSANIQPV